MMASRIARQSTGLYAKGATVSSTLDFLRAEPGAGDEAVARVLATLPAGVRAKAMKAGDTEEVDYAVLVRLWEAIDAELAPKDAAWMERAGAWSIAQRGTHLYGGILRKKDPSEFLTQSVSLFRLFYHPGDMRVVEHAAGRAVLRLVGFDPGTPLFCRRQTGGLREALEIARGERPTARHVRCALEGDAFCEWELTWDRPSPSSS